VKSTSRKGRQTTNHRQRTTENGQRAATLSPAQTFALNAFAFFRCLRFKPLSCFARPLRLHVSNGGQEFRVSDLQRSCCVSSCRNEAYSCAISVAYLSAISVAYLSARFMVEIYPPLEGPALGIPVGLGSSSLKPGDPPASRCEALRAGASELAE
jgi:hypothetical protein